MSENRCERCNRQLSDPTAQYGWRCAEILGVTRKLNHAGDNTFLVYMQGIESASKYLEKNNINIKNIDIMKFYESYAKQYLAAGKNNHYLHSLAYDDMLSSLSPRYDKNGKMLVADPLSLPLSSYLAWFNHVDAANGVLDQKTQWAADLAKGIIPSTNFINLLQTNITDVGVRATLLKDNKTKKYQLYDVLTKQRLLEFDKHGLPNAKGTIISDTPHMNIETTKNASSLQKQVATTLNHRPIPTSVYNAFKNFDDVAKIAKNGGKALAVAGIVLDTYELGSTIYLDLNDEDRKLGKKTIKTSIGIGGSYAGSFGGAKLGTMGGAAIGTAICPGLGTIIGGILGGIGGGIAGAIGGRALGEYVVDKTYNEEE